MLLTLKANLNNVDQTDAHDQLVIRKAEHLTNFELISRFFVDLVIGNCCYCRWKENNIEKAEVDRYYISQKMQ
jgi:hypothetical protein